jgi:hypothetical protein
MKRSPIDFGTNYVGEPEPSRLSWFRATVAALLVFVVLPAVVGLAVAQFAVAVAAR